MRSALLGAALGCLTWPAVYALAWLTVQLAGVAP